MRFIHRDHNGSVNIGERVVRLLLGIDPPIVFVNTRESDSIRQGSSPQ